MPFYCWTKACNAMQVTMKQVALLNRRRPTIAILPSGINIAPHLTLLTFLDAALGCLERAHEC